MLPNASSYNVKGALSENDVTLEGEGVDKAVTDRDKGRGGSKIMTSQNNNFVCDKNKCFCDGA